jgi:hypothetical protein
MGNTQERIDFGGTIIILFINTLNLILLCISSDGADQHKLGIRITSLGKFSS